MKLIKNLLAVMSLTFFIGCSSGSKEPTKTDPTPVSKTYGVFRKLSPKVKSAAKVKPAAKESSFAMVGSINMTPRRDHRAIQMLDGRILLCGGDVYTTSVNNIATMDIYDPTTETFTQSNAHPHVSFTYQEGNSSSAYLSYSSFAMVNLPDGRVWIGGANNFNGIESESYDIYDPTTDTITNIPIITRVGENDYPRVQPLDEAYYFGDNKIFLLMSFGIEGILDLNTQLIQWFTNTSAIDAGLTILSGSSTIQDQDGNIWQIGGGNPPTPVLPNGGSVSTIFKLDAKTLTWTRKHDLINVRENANIVILPNNKIGIYGGKQVINSITTILDSVEIYDIINDSIEISTPLVGKRIKSTGTYLQTGYTLVAGGNSGIATPEDSELVHKSDIGFSGSTGLMTVGRFGHTATPLPNGLVLVAGGGTPEAQNTAEIFDPQTRLYISYTSEQILVGNTMQFSAKDATGNLLAVNWSVNKTDLAMIDSNGLLTTIANGNVEVSAISTSDSTIKAIVRIHILPM
jgi:hypothetical protein